ncbi:hypothetical protein NPT69_003999 [Salmonella enterica subsp. enterica serovar Yaba]|nr:hypothetical protein [Salmonella enterica subsp. enterica serovar Yaba]
MNTENSNKTVFYINYGHYNGSAGGYFSDGLAACISIADGGRERDLETIFAHESESGDYPHDDKLRDANFSTWTNRVVKSLAKLITEHESASEIVVYQASFYKGEDAMPFIIKGLSKILARDSDVRKKLRFPGHTKFWRVHQ